MRNPILYKVWQRRSIVLAALCFVIFPLAMFLVAGALNDISMGLGERYLEEKDDIRQYYILEMLLYVLFAMQFITLFWLVGYGLKSLYRRLKPIANI